MIVNVDDDSCWMRDTDIACRADQPRARSRRLGGARQAREKAAPDKAGKQSTRCRSVLRLCVVSTCSLAIVDLQVIPIDGHRRIFLSERCQRANILSWRFAKPVPGDRGGALWRPYRPSGSQQAHRGLLPGRRDLRRRSDRLVAEPLAARRPPQVSPEERARRRNWMLGLQSAEKKAA